MLPVLVVAMVMVIGPGVPAALALRVRGFMLLPVAIAAACAATALGSLVAPRLGFAWTPIVPFATGVAVAALLLAGWRVFRPSTQRPRKTFAREWTVPLFALALGAILATVIVASGIRYAIAIPQNFDGVFHLNAVQYVLETGSASPFDMHMTSDATRFYPTLWHGMVANIMTISGASIPLATNAMILTVNALVWPVAAITLSRGLFGASANVTLAAGVTSAAFSAFPLIMAPWNSLYPNLLATAILPCFIAFALVALGFTEGSSMSRPQGFVAAIGALGAATLAHPNVFFSAALLIAPAVASMLWRQWRNGAPWNLRIGSSLTTLFGIAVFVFAWEHAGTADNRTDFRRGGFRGALLDALSNSAAADAHAWGITALVALGVWAAWRLRVQRWWTFSYIIAIALYVNAAGQPDSPLRTFFTGPWYNDAYRLTSLTAVTALPFAVLGLSRVLVTLQRGVLTRMRPRSLLPPRTRRRQLTVTSLAALLTVAAAIQSPAIQTGIQGARWTHDPLSPDSAVNPEEARLFELLPEYVPEDALIANDPSNGSALAYALADRHVLFPYFEGNSSPDAWVLAAELKDGSPEACAAISRLGVGYVLDFGTQFIAGSEFRAATYPGLNDVSGSPILTEALAVGDAKLYTVTGCK